MRVASYRMRADRSGVYSVDRVWMLVRDGRQGREVMHSPPATNPRQCWIVATNYYNDSQDDEPDYDEKQRRLRAIGWRARRLVIGEVY